MINLNLNNNLVLIWLIIKIFFEIKLLERHLCLRIHERHTKHIIIEFEFLTLQTFFD